MSTTLTLSIKEIVELCLFSGVSIDVNQFDEEPELLETEMCICPAQGRMLRFEQSDGSVKEKEYTGNIAWFSEYTEEGVYPLGKEK